MKIYQHIQSELQADNLSNLMLYGAIMLANIDYMSIADYLIKAVLGGGVWFGFKLLQDYYSARAKAKIKAQLKKEETETKTEDK